MKEAIEQIQNLFAEGLSEAGSNYQAAMERGTETQKNTADEGGEVIYSLRAHQVPTREELEKKDPVKVVDISKPQTTGTFAQRRRQILEQAQEVIKKPYLNKDTGVMIFLTPKSYTHMFSNSGALKMNAAEHLPELVENAILTHAEDPEYGSDYTDGVYTFFAAAMYETLVPVKMKVKEYSYEGQRLPANIEAYFQGLPQEYASSYDTVVLQVEEIEKSPSGSARGVNQNDPLPGPEGLSTITVAELLDLVKGDAKKYIPQHEKSFSERTGEGVSGRAMLADAFEGLAQTDLERKKIQEYREKAAQYDAEEQKLRELRGQIKELSFAKGPRDKKQLLALQTEATRSANRINIYDKQLLRLEASAPLKAVLEREKAKTAQRIKKQHDKAMAEYRAEALRKQESIAKRYQESRKQGIENQIVIK